MDTRRQIELVGVIAAYFLVYVTVIGPLIGSLAGFETPVLTLDASRGSQLVRVLTTPRGWLLVLGFLPALFGYMAVRARLAGEPMATYWSE